MKSKFFRKEVFYDDRKKDGLLKRAKKKRSGSRGSRNILCSQFLRDYIDLPYMKDVHPEDIEDVSEQYVPLFAEERNADRVKRVNIKGENPFFLLSLIEHKTQIDYNVCMQIFRYMVYIWDAYEKEAEKFHKGISKRADFKYPPILPIVYYEGSKKWSVPLNFKSRILEGDKFGEYLPDFKYYLVPLRDYSNEELIAKEDEISLVMLINKMQTQEDIEMFRMLPTDKVDTILRDSPGHLVDIIADILLAFLLKENVPVPEAEELAGKVKEKKMAQLFENMEKMDIQAERRNTAQAIERAEKAEQKAAEAQQKVEELEKKMAQLFENMEKMDIQAERRNTAQAIERAEKAEQRVEELEKKMAQLFENMEKMDDIQAERRNTAQAIKRAEKAEQRVKELEKKMAQLLENMSDNT